MAKALSSTISNQISSQNISGNFTFTINGIDYSSSLMTWSVSYSKEFGSASGNFTLTNPDGIFSVGGANEIRVGDIVALTENYVGDTTNWYRFYGKVEQRSVGKSANNQDITFTCLDYVSVLKHWDIDIELEGTKVEITEENLVPNYLTGANSMFAQVFDFRNGGVAINPAPIIMIRDRVHTTDDPQYDGFDILYEQGQVKFGSPLNARDNYDVIARSYYFYTTGLYAEDILETLLTTADGYGNFLFDEPTAALVTSQHLKTTFQDEGGAGIRDTLTPNYTTSTITIKHQLALANLAGATSIKLDSIEGLPASGSGSIAGDTFTWTNINAGTKTLTGIPATGANSLKEHPINSYMKYEHDYTAGQVWYLSYSNLVSDLTSANFTLPAGATINYVDKRFGRIILLNPISTASVLKCNYNYEFKTLQATGIEINAISFRSREVENRYAAIEKLRGYLAPNWIIRTQGDSKIWASYLSQKVSADYTLNLVEQANYLEDEDLYSRVKFFAKNKNPLNIMLNENVSLATTGQSYKAFASQNELSYEKTQDGKHYFKSLITDVGRIVSDFFTPLVYIDGVAIDNQLHQLVAQPIKIKQTTRTETQTSSSKFGGTSSSTTSYYYYKILFAQQNILSSEDIILYNANGVHVMTIPANSSQMDYSRGIYDVPGTAQNSTVETLSTATYWINYSTDILDIDYDSVRFLINASVIPDPNLVTIWATYEYYTVFTPQRGSQAIMDGRWDTQVQTEFFAQPPAGYPYAILDLGTSQAIQAVDIIGGYYKPDEYRKFDVDFRISLQYSDDNVTYRDISDKTNNLSFTGGQSVSLEEDALGVNLTARYIKISIDNVKKIPYGDNGVYVIALSEVSVYSDVVISSEASLIATAELTATETSASTTIDVDSTAGFTDPSSGQTATAYIGSDGDYFTYSGLTATTFTGCDVSSGVSATAGTKVYQSLETDTTLYDDDYLLRSLGDRLYKKNLIDDNTLYSQAEIDYLVKVWLKEFYKNHSKMTTSVLYQPYLKVGDTLQVTDTYNFINDLYFIEAVNESNGMFNLTLAKYP